MEATLERENLMLKMAEKRKQLEMLRNSSSTTTTTTTIALNINNNNNNNHNTLHNKDVPLSSATMRGIPDGDTTPLGGM